MEPALPISRHHETGKTQTHSSLLSNEKIFVAGSVIFAFLIRLFLFPQNTVINGDGTYYASLGGKLIHGNFSEGISTYWSPLYPLLIGIVSLVFHDLEFAGRVVSMIAGTLLIIPAYFLIAAFYGRRAAYLGTVFIAVYPSLIKSSVWVMTESLYILIFTTALLTGWLALRKSGSERRRKLNFFLTGILFGAAYLTKPEAIGFLALFFALTIAAKFFRRRLSSRSLAAGFLLLLTGFAIFSMPYIFYMHEKTGRWMISKKLSSNFTGFDTEIDSDKGWLSLSDDGQMTMRDRFFADDYESKNSPLTGQPAAVSAPVSPIPKEYNVNRFYSNVSYNLKNQVSEYIRNILPTAFILIILIGFFFKPWTRLRAEREFYLFSFITCTLIGYALTVIELRYLFALIPIFLAFSARGVVELGAWTSKLILRLRRPQWNVKPLVPQILLLFILLISLTSRLAELEKPDSLEMVPFEEKEAGLWIKDHSNAAPTVMSSGVAAAFYAGGTHIFLPDENFATVLEYAKRKKVDYVVYSQRRLSSTPIAMPNENQNLQNEFKLVFQDRSRPNYEVFIYQVQK